MKKNILSTIKQAILNSLGRPKKKTDAKVVPAAIAPEIGVSVAGERHLQRAADTIFRPQQIEPAPEPAASECAHLWRSIPQGDERCDSCGVQKSQLRAQPYVRTDSFVVASRAAGGAVVMRELSCATGETLAERPNASGHSEFLARWSRRR
jgi:hypothetical protein